MYTYIYLICAFCRFVVCLQKRRGINKKKMVVRAQTINIFVYSKLHKLHSVIFLCFLCLYFHHPFAIYYINYLNIICMFQKCNLIAKTYKYFYFLFPLYLLTWKVLRTFLCFFLYLYSFYSFQFAAVCPVPMHFYFLCIPFLFILNWFAPGF